MSKPEVLNFDAHGELRVETARGARFGENVHFVPVIAEELASLVLDYVVCLMKDPETGAFGLFALTGLSPGENLYLDGDRWDAAYVPLHVRRQPFVVLRNPGSDEDGQDSAVIAIDVSSERLHQSTGEALFNADGSRTPYLEDVSRMLGRLMSGLETTRGMIETLAERDLIEPLPIDVQSADGENRRFEGLYGISHQKLNALAGDELGRFHGEGYLQASHLMLASLGHLEKLVQRKFGEPTPPS